MWAARSSSRRSRRPCSAGSAACPAPSSAASASASSRTSPAATSTRASPTSRPSSSSWSCSSCAPRGSSGPARCGASSGAVAPLAGRRNVFGLAALALAALPALANPYILYVTNIALIYVILAVGLNLLLGYAGQFAFANAALFGIGAYATGLLQVKLGLPFWVAFPGAVLFTTLIGVVVALPALRLSGLYLALVTLAFAQLTQWVMLNWERVTFGAGGFKVPPLTFGPVSPALGLYYLTLVLAGLLVAGAWNTVRSGVGRALVAVRDSEVAAEALAIDLARYKTIAFSMSALYAGVAGGLYSAALSFVAPEGFDLFQMVVQFSLVVVGGLGSVWGSVLGAGLLVGLQESLRAFKGGQEIAFGLLLMACIIFLPDGLISLVKRRVPGWEEPLRAPDPPA